MRTPKADLRQALECTGDVRDAEKVPVLLVHGTGGTPAEDWGWNYLNILPQMGYPACTVTIPGRSLGDVQVNVEYVVHAIRHVSQRRQGRIAVLGHSQGAFLSAFALRFWPGLARRVRDFVGFAGVYARGSDFGPVLCALACTDAVLQLSPGSNLLRAIARKPVPAAPDYTAYLTLTDELLVPQPDVSTLVAPGARNYTLQDLCPADPGEHLLLPGQAPLLAVTLDALEHRGPGRLERLDEVPCGLVPGSEAVVPQLASFLVGLASEMPDQASTVEPPLRCYLRPGCSG